MFRNKTRLSWRTSAMFIAVCPVMPPLAFATIANDFNGDGMSDILWRHSVTGGNALWLMNGATRTSSANLPLVNPVWNIAGVGDFNGDGKSDILWRHSVTGGNALWLMNGATRTSSANLPLVNMDWRVMPPSSGMLSSSSM